MAKEGKSVTSTLQEENLKSQDDDDDTIQESDPPKDNTEEIATEQSSDFSPPKPESAPVVAPLTVEDVINLHSPDQKPSDASLIVNVDDMQSDLDGDLEGTLSEAGSEKYREDNRSNSNNSNDDKQGLISECKDKQEDEDASKTRTIDPEKEEANLDNSGSSSQKKTNHAQEADEAATEGEQQKQESADKKEAVQEGGNISVTETAEQQPSAATDAASKAKSTGLKDNRSASKDETKGERVKRVVAASRNLWVSGLAANTRAADLKTLFSKHGKVVGAKIVTNAKIPGSRCYGFMTMATSEEASKCIQHLHRTELHGKMISVEKTKHEPFGLKRVEGKPGSGTVKKVTAKDPGTVKTATPAAVKKTEKAEEEKKEGEAEINKDNSSEEPKGEEEQAEQGEEQISLEENKEENEEDEDEGSKEKDKSEEKEGSVHSRSKGYSTDRSRRGFTRRPRPFGGRGRGSRFYGGRGRGSYNNFSGSRNFSQRRDYGRKPFLPRFGSRFNRSSSFPFQRFKDNRFNRLRDRDVERRRSQEYFRQKEIERKQREESFKLDRERERLRYEREKLERERAEILRLEREKQKMEREHLEREREELRRRQQFSRMDEPRRGSKRNFNRTGSRESDPYWEDRKRPALSSHFSRDGSFHGESSNRENFSRHDSFGKSGGRGEDFNISAKTDFSPVRRGSRRTSESTDREENRVIEKSRRYEGSTPREETGHSSASREREPNHRGPKEVWKTTYDKRSQDRRGRFIERGKGGRHSRGSFRGGRGGSWNAERSSGATMSGSWSSESRKVGFSQNQWRRMDSTMSPQEGMLQQTQSGIYSSSSMGSGGSMSHSSIGGSYGGNRYMGGPMSRY